MEDSLNPKKQQPREYFTRIARDIRCPSEKLWGWIMGYGQYLHIGSGPYQPTTIEFFREEPHSCPGRRLFSFGYAKTTNVLPSKFDRKYGILQILAPELNHFYVIYHAYIGYDERCHPLFIELRDNFFMNDPNSSMIDDDVLENMKNYNPLITPPRNTTVPMQSSATVASSRAVNKKVKLQDRRKINHKLKQENPNLSDPDIAEKATFEIRKLVTKDVRSAHPDWDYIIDRESIETEVDEIMKIEWTNGRTEISRDDVRNDRRLYRPPA